MNIAGKKVLVTGGAGFVGSNVVKKLVQTHGCAVTVLDDLFTGELEFLDGLDVEFVKGSVCDVPLVNELAARVDVIFHMACRNIIVSNSNPREDLEVNVIGTFNILEAAKNNKIEKVVYTSTASVYGSPKVLPISEDAEKEFLSFYSASKFNGEVYCKAFYEVFDVPVAIVRYSNVYGYNQLTSNPYCGVIGKFIDAAVNNKVIAIHGDGEQTRDYTFVDDAVEATIAAAIVDKAVGNIYNIATGVEISVKALAELILSISGSSTKIEYIDKRDIDNIRKRYLSIEKIRHDLKFSPLVRLEAGLQKTIEWQKKYHDAHK